MSENKNTQTVRELAYKLWQIRSVNGRHSTPEQDWYDAEVILNEDAILTEKGQSLLKEIEKD